jgi:hypothetical protein
MTNYENGRGIYHTVELSDGKPCQVRQLGLFELDFNLSPPQRPRFTYELESITGKTYDVEFLVENFDTPPVKPDVPEHEIEKGSDAWYLLREWQLYQAALHYEKERMREIAQYQQDTVFYILNKCLSPEDVDRIVTDDDWLKVHRAALVAPVTMTALRRCLRDVYQATYHNKEIFEALAESESGGGQIDAIKKWENELMIAMGLTEEQYCLMPVQERIMKIIAHKFDDWVGHLEIDKWKRQNG